MRANLGFEEHLPPPPPTARVANRSFELLGNPLRTALLGALIDGPRIRSDLIAGLGAAPSTLDSHLSDLEQGGLIHRRQSSEFPTQTTISLVLGAGRALVRPLSETARWLERAGLDPLAAQGPKTARAASLLSWSWRHRVIDHLATSPKTATQLIANTDAGERALHNRLRELVNFEIVTVTRRDRNRPNLYALSPLGHALIGTLAAFVRYELLHHPGTAALLTVRDVATAIIMACNLIDPSRMRPGRYAFAVNLADGNPAGLIIDFSPERWVLVTNPRGPIRYGIRGNPLPWLDAILDLQIRRVPAEKSGLTIRPHDCNFIELVHEAIGGV